MFATLLVVGMTCWLAMFSPAEAAPGDQTDAPPLFDNLGSLHHPIATTSEPTLFRSGAPTRLCLQPRRSDPVV